MSGGRATEDLLRDHAPRVLGALVRRHGRFELCEDAVQEALAAAALQWPRDGVPRDPAAWLTTVASRRLVDEVRSEGARRRRETAEAAGTVPAAEESAAGDDTLVLLFLCCHPSLSAPSQLALTLRAVGGLTTAEIARAFLVPDATMAQRISRAKQTIGDAGARFDLPPAPERPERTRVVMQVLYLVFTEGHTATSGREPVRSDLTTEAIRLARILHRLLPADCEVAGLLALMLLTDARRAARIDRTGALVPLAHQRRELWNREQIGEGLDLLARTLGGPVGAYQVQAAIAALHDEATDAAQTDWPQILALYDVLATAFPSPVVDLNRAVAVAMVHGPRAGLDQLGALEADERLARSHRLDAVRGHLLELAGDPAGARTSYLRAAAATASTAERDHLTARAARLA